MNKSETFEISQSALISHDRKILVLQSKNWEWVFPWWKIDVWEKWNDALEREINEEIWKRNLQILSILEVDNWDYQWKSKFWVFFHCIADKVNDIILSNEHLDYKWVWYDELDNVNFFHNKMIDIAKKALLPLLETREYDVCIVWKWVVWKFLMHELNNQWLNICVIDWYEEDSLETDEVYNVYDYLDKEWVWDKNATWNITFPNEDEIKELWFTLEEYESIKLYLLSTLWWIDFSKYNDTEIESLKKFVLEKLWINNLNYFLSARNKIEKKQIFDRWEFDRYWHSNKTFYDINWFQGDVIKWNADKFIYLRDTILDNLLIKTDTWTKVIRANKFILANHSIWVMSLLKRTQAFLWSDFLDGSKIWLWFVEHPQLSIWAIIKDENFSFDRNLPTTYLYSDFSTDWINFRIEYHTAPPIKEKARRYYYDGRTEKDFESRFIRFSCIIEQKPSASDKTLDFNDNKKIYTTDFFKEDIEKITKIVCEKLYEILLKAQENDQIEILNPRSKIYFSWHLIGGLQFLTDKTGYKIESINNLYIASSSTFKTWWLFNPTFTILCMAKKIINDNFNF